MRIERLHDVDHMGIAVVHELEAEAGEQCEHWVVVGQDQADERPEARACRILGKRADQARTQPLPLVSVIDNDRKLGVGWLAHGVLCQSNDPLSRAICRLGHERELA